jgi:translation initiation factor 5B
MPSMLRSPIVTVLGHVDHGKSTLLDNVRGTNIVDRESGSITQSIGASKLPMETVRERAGSLFSQLGDKVDLPGLLFIDTPGHAAFTALRERGSSLANLAVLVVDVQDGLQPQTEEAIRILQEAQTPFVIAANKIDLVHGFDTSSTSFLDAYHEQSDAVQHKLDQRIYELIGELHDSFDLQADRFDRVDDYQETLAIVPCSAKENIGLGEVLFVLVGLAQRFLEDDLEVSRDDAGKGVVLEVKEEQGMGKTLDTILYDGFIGDDDEVIIDGLNGPIQGQIRGLFMPKELSDSRDESAEYQRVDKAVAATGVKILSPQVTDDVISGMDVEVVRDNEDELMELFSSEERDLGLDLDEEGVLAHANTLGGLEALVTILQENDVPVRHGNIGDVTKKALADAQSNLEENPEYAVVLGFNVEQKDTAEDVGVFTSDVIYELVDDADDFIHERRERADRDRLRKLTPPAKVRVLRDCVFRKSGPCIVGVRVLEGVLHTNTYVMSKQGEKLGMVKSIQEDGENVSRATKGDQVAVSLPDGDAERNVDVEMLLFSDLLEDEFREYKELSHLLNDDLKRLIKEIAEIKRGDQPLWGV